MTIENDSDLDPQETQEWLEALEAVLVDWLKRNQTFSVKKGKCDRSKT